MPRLGLYSVVTLLLSFSAGDVSAVMQYRPEPTDSAVVEGVVVDATTGRPLAGTLVRVVGTSRQDLTHEGGEFHLRNVPPGTRTILFERLGYSREVREVHLAEGERLVLRIEMTASAIALPGLVVTGQARAGLGDESVRPANVLSGQ